ncbi:aminoacyl-tRNA hydrolase [Patescibacteria group bacterium]
MFLIVGLGNPGQKFQKTRHNLGFEVIDEFSKENGFPEFKISKKFKSLVSEGSLDKKKIILAKPQIFMNNSGKSVRSLIDFYKIKKMNLILVHDDIDLALGKIKISKGRGAAGHKGVESVILELKTKNFVRFRIGINNLKSEIKSTERFVLKKFSKEEQKIVKEIIGKTAKAIEIFLKEGLEKAMQEFNK